MGKCPILPAFTQERKLITAVISLRGQHSFLILESISNPRKVKIWEYIDRSSFRTWGPSKGTFPPFPEWKTGGISVESGLKTGGF